MKLNSKSINYNVQTVDELVSLDGLEGDTVVVTDENRGGVFVYREDNVGTNNEGTIFNGWTRQYDGAVNVKWFGAKGDGTNDDTKAIQTALLSGVSRISAPEGVYRITDLITIPDSVIFEGDGVDFWASKGSWRPRKMGKGTTILACGVPTTRVVVENVSNMESGGGVVNNDDFITESFSGNYKYSLLDYTNNDADGSTPASPKQLKVAVLLGNNSSISNLRVQLNYLGVDGYNSKEALVDFPEYTASYTGLGDDWDIGVLTHNKINTEVKDCQVVGYWRMAARAVVSSNYGDGKSYSGAVFKDSNIFYQGYNGLSIRGCDSYRVTAVTTTSIEIPWSPSHTVPKSGTIYLPRGKCNFTNSEKVGDKLKLTRLSIDPTTMVTVGEDCSFGTNSAYAGSSVKEGFITGLSHFSNFRAYDSVNLEETFPNPSKAHEISGKPLRDIDFYNCHFFDTDCVGFLHDSLHISYVGCYAEAQGFAGGIPGVVKGARFIASAKPGLVEANGQYPAGNCRGFFWDDSSEMSDGSVDLYPVYRSATSRFSGTSNYFMPDDFKLLGNGYWAPREDTKRRFDHGPRYFTNGPKNDLSIMDSTLKPHMYVDASKNAIGFGTTLPASNSLHKKGDSPLLILEAEGDSKDSSIVLRNSIGSWAVRPQSTSINQLQFRFNSSIKMQINKDSGTIFSGADNTADLGSANNRFSNIYAAAGVINTSDDRVKTYVKITDAEKLAALELKTNMKKFKFNDAIELKGDKARIHFGASAQTVVSIFEKHGLDASEYALLCYDEWEEQEEIKDEDGTIIEPYRPSGNRYGIRYEELLCFIMSAL